MNPEDAALAALGRVLKDRGYHFTTVTPVTHQRVIARPPKNAASLADIFGWSRPFRPEYLPDDLMNLLRAADELDESGTLMRSRVRFSTLGQQLFVHSAFPTEDADAVFFGPDTYRFARTIQESLADLPPRPRPRCRIGDIGAGSGAGGLHAAALLAEIWPDVVLTDINRRALRFSRVNAVLNGASGVQIVESDLFDNVDGRFDLIISNPPYLVDPLARFYRHGGGALGADLSLRIVEQGIPRLAPKGRLILYTGSCVIDGEDTFQEALRRRLPAAGIRFRYDEIDPDVFGEELEHPPYDRADRIAAVRVIIDAV
jgi:methylase of polypeptide subunit release factors